MVLCYDYYVFVELQDQLWISEEFKHTPAQIQAAWTQMHTTT